MDVRYPVINHFMPCSRTYSGCSGRIVCEQGVRSADSVGPRNCQDLLRGASVGLVPFLVLYCITSTALSTAAVMEFLVAGVCRIRWRLAFTSAGGDRLPISSVNIVDTRIMSQP